MRTPTNAKAGHSTASPVNHRRAGVRPQNARTIEHRTERRKIREHLRRLDWALNVEDEVFA